MHQDSIDQRTIFCEYDPHRRERIAAAFTQSGYSGQLVFVSSPSETVQNIRQDGINVVFLRQDRDGTSYAGEICACSRASIVIMVTPDASDQESLDAIQNGGAEAVLEDENSIRNYPQAAARAVACWNSLLPVRAILDWLPDPILVTGGRAVFLANSAFTAAFGKISGTADTGLWAVLLRNALESASPFDISCAGETFRVELVPIHLHDRTFRLHLFRNCTELKRVRDQLHQRSRPALIGMLVSGVAHDVNNALTGTLAYAELLGLDVSDAGAKQDLRKIVESAERCKKILDNLLSFTRERPPAKSFESVNDLIDRTLDLYNYRLRSRGIIVYRDYGQLPAVFIDGQQLQQVILNILAHAEQAVAAPVRSPGTIRFSTIYRKEDRMLILRISNNGPGISENGAERIFEPFFAQKNGVGSSLGLSEAYGIIREHGGTISAQNDPAGGSIFIIELPTGTAPAA